MATINLRDFYPWYTQNEFVDVPEDVEAELLADKRYENAYRRRMYYNKAQYSLDAGNGIEAAMIRHAPSPEEIVERKERDYNLYQTIRTLPEKQRNRINAHYLLGMKQREIAEVEGVTTKSVTKSVRSGLQSMPKLYRKIERDGYYLRSK